MREINGTENASSEPFVTSLPGVPAGRYQFVVRARRPLGGTLTLDGGTPSARRLALEPRTEQRVDWTTAEDAVTVRMTFDAVMIRSRASVELVPVSLAARGQ